MHGTQKFTISFQDFRFQNGPSEAVNQFKILKGLQVSKSQKSCGILGVHLPVDH